MLRILIIILVALVIAGIIWFPFKKKAIKQTAIIMAKDYDGNDHTTVALRSGRWVRLLGNLGDPGDQINIWVHPTTGTIKVAPFNE